LNLAATLAVDLCGEDVAGRPNEPGDLECETSLACPDVCDVTALAKSEHLGQLGRFVTNARGRDPSGDEPAAGGSYHEDEARQLWQRVRPHHTSGDEVRPD
jgi:hypothetical protein